MSPSPVAAWRSHNDVRVRFDAHGGELVTEESNRPAVPFERPIGPAAPNAGMAR